VRITTRTVVLLACLAALAAFTLSGCVYYNTFYHARSAYAEAERIRATRPPDSEPTPQESEQLDRVIEKSGRVLALHPDSDWADDAILLMAQALYRQGRYESAESRLNEFSTLYPDSDLEADAGYLLAAVMLARDNPVSAEQTLAALAYADPPVELSDDALVMIGRARHSRRRFDEAAEAYASALERFPNSDLRAEIRFLAAENFVKMGRLEEAAHHLAAVGEERGARRLAFEGRIRLAEVYLDIGRLGDALEVLTDVERRTTDRDDLDRVLLLRGRTQQMMGDLEDAVSTYEGIAASHERSKAAAEALYRVGLILRDGFGTFEEAVEAFREAKDEAPRTEVSREAADAIRDIEELQESLAIIESWLAGPAAVDTLAAAGDTTGAAGDTLSAVADTLGAAADTLGAAADTTGAVADTLDAARGGSQFAPADTLSAAQTDTLASGAIDQSQFVTMLADAPVTAADSLSASVDTLLALSDSLAVAPPDTFVSTEPDTVAIPDEARAMFRAGEIYLFKMDNAETAVEYYEMVVEHFGETPLGPKAALAVAWARGEMLDQPMLSAEAYRSVLEMYPDTDYAREAERVLAEVTGASPGEAAGGAPGEPLEETRGGNADDPPEDTTDEPLQTGGGEVGP